MPGDPGPGRRAVLAGLGSAALVGAAPVGMGQFRSRRPAPADRKFVSPAVEREIVRATSRIADREIAWMFANCYPNTLDTTVEMGTIDGKPDAFVITGDIPCLWLRDSAAQAYAYLPLAQGDRPLQTLFRGLIARHCRSILLDPYANAFMRDSGAATSLEWAKHDLTDMKPGVAERKWEIDSLCHVVRLAYGYWAATRDPAPFDALWGEAARTIVRTFREQQRLTSPGPYHFQRPAPSATDTLILGGYGAPTRKIGLIHSMFRPSDDACVYPFLVPANLFAVAALRSLAILAREARPDAALARDALACAGQIEDALRRHALLPGAGGRYWAYEIDGFGNSLFMDDANVPSLSSLPYLGCADPQDEVYRRTEAMCWSDRNPYYFTGKAGAGIGGPHVGLGQIWPMSLIVRALCSDDDRVIRQSLRTLKATHGDTGFMHESFDANDASAYTRAWFAWANGLFGELILKLLRDRPALLADPI